MADIALKRLGTFAKSVTTPSFEVSTYTNSIYRVSHSTGFLRQKLSDKEVNEMLDKGREVCVQLNEFPPGQEEFLAHLTKNRQSMYRQSSFSFPDNYNHHDSSEQHYNDYHSHLDRLPRESSQIGSHSQENDGKGRVSQFSRYTMDSTFTEISSNSTQQQQDRKSILKKNGD